MEIGDLVQLHHIEFEFKGVAPHDIGVIVAIDQTGPHHPWPRILWSLPWRLRLSTSAVGY